MDIMDNLNQQGGYRLMETRTVADLMKHATEGGQQHGYTPNEHLYEALRVYIPKLLVEAEEYDRCPDAVFGMISGIASTLQFIYEFDVLKDLQEIMDGEKIT